jgi:hypothetical protein
MRSTQNGTRPYQPLAVGVPHHHLHLLRARLAIGQLGDLSHLLDALAVVYFVHRRHVLEGRTRRVKGAEGLCGCGGLGADVAPDEVQPMAAIAITKITQRPSAARTIQSQVRFDGAIEVS